VASWKRSKGVLDMRETIAQDDIEVTPKMVEVGTAVFRKFINTDRYDPVYDVEEIVAFIFSAMLTAHSDDQLRPEGPSGAD